MNKIIFCIILFVAGLYFGILVSEALHEERNIIVDKVHFAVKHCEKELPRNQFCEPVYSARIKD